MYHRSGLADQRHAARRRRRQQCIERSQLPLAGLHAVTSMKSRPRRIVDQVHVDPVERRAIARRHDGIELAPAACSAISFCASLPGLLAKWDVVIEIGVIPISRSAPQPRARGAGGGENDGALAGGFQPAQSLERGRMTRCHHAGNPQIKDEGVVAIAISPGRGYGRSWVTW
jgi:hypothetical protein